MFDPHGGPQTPIYAGHGDLPGDTTNRMLAEGATLRFGVVTAVDDVTTHETSSVTVNGIKMPHLASYSPQVADWVAWLEMESIRLCLGEYGQDIPRIKTFFHNAGLIPPAASGAPGVIYFDTNATTDYQRSIGHSHAFFADLFSINKAGTHNIDIRFEFGPGDGTYRGLYLYLNGNLLTYDYDYTPSVFLPSTLCIHGPMELAVTDTLSIGYAHNASGSIALNSGRLSTYVAINRFAANV